MAQIRFETLQSPEQSGPIIRCTFPAQLDEDALEQSTKRTAELLRTYQLFAVLNDGRAFTGNIEAAQRREIAEFMKNNHGALSRQCAGWCDVISSSLMRGALTAVMWIKRPPHPHKCVATPEEGMAWLAEQLAAKKKKDGASASASSISAATKNN